MTIRQQCLPVPNSFTTRVRYRCATSLKLRFANAACVLKQRFSQLGELSSVATLFLQKSTRFHDKKKTLQKKTLDYKIKLTHSENAQKMRCNANHRHVQLTINQRERKREKAATFVCLYRLLKLLTDGQVTSQRSQIKTYYIVLCNLKFNEVEHLANYNCTKSKGLNYCYNYTKWCISLNSAHS